VLDGSSSCRTLLSVCAASGNSSPTTYKEITLTLEEYFLTEPKGAKLEMAQYLGVSATWISLLIHGRRLASAKLCVDIERATQGLVTRKELRPDLYGDVALLEEAM
jgi:DNA-binding transcriptional regulator YdaS (Cro superfamily)